MAMPDLSLTEWVVLALVAEGPSHGFAIGRELQPNSDLGRILTVHRPLVYRALDRLSTGGLIEQVGTEPGEAGPNRTVMRASRRGRASLKQWFVTPVDHVRDLRIEFLIKLRLTERLGRDAGGLIAAQRAELEQTLSKLAEAGNDDDVVDRWRQHNATAARNFLNGLT